MIIIHNCANIIVSSNTRICSSNACFEKCSIVLSKADIPHWWPIALDPHNFITQPPTACSTRAWWRSLTNLYYTAHDSNLHITAADTIYPRKKHRRIGVNNYFHVPIRMPLSCPLATPAPKAMIIKTQLSWTKNKGKARKCNNCKLVKTNTQKKQQHQNQQKPLKITRSS